MMHRSIRLRRERVMSQAGASGMLNRFVAWLPCLALLMALSGQGIAQPIQVTDDRGRAFVLPQAPQRIVSLLPSLTESVCALGRCASLVGVDRYSTWPESVRSLVQLGSGLEPNVEAIVALKPDVVLLSNSSRVIGRLEGLGLKVLALEPRTQQDVRRVLGTIGTLLGIPPEEGADRVWRQIQTGMEDAAGSVPDELRGARVYFEVSRGPYVAGPSSFIGEMLERLGADNVVPATLGPFPRLSPEFVVRAQPDVILMADRSMQAARLYPGWNQLEAVQAQRVCVFDGQQSDIIVRPGPRMALAAQMIAQCLIDKAPVRAKEHP
jgi:iron complex transport system substrate-binding protein